jgi:Gas vesicle synthesis protein GvpL/GvpF
VIELYAITDDAGPRLPDLAPLHAVAVAGLAGVWAPADDGELSPETLWRHEEVVEALMEERDLLPVRYGTRLADAAAAARVIEQRHDELAEALEHIRGAVELSIRALHVDRPPAAAHTPQADGGDYLRAKARQAGERQHAADALHGPLSSLARSSVTSAPRAPHEVLRSAYLVDRAAIARFADRVARLQNTNPSLRLLCTGPWPPYSFAVR